MAVLRIIPRVPPAQALVLVAIMVTEPACSSVARITLSGKGTIDAEIVGGDESSIHVLDMPGPRSVHMERLTVSRDQIEEIKHPGTVHLALGAALAAVGTVGVALGAEALNGGCAERNPYDSEGSAVGWSDESVCGFFALVGLLNSIPLVVSGVPMSIWGAVTWAGSRSRSSPPTHASGDAGSPDVRLLGVAPVVSEDRELRGVVVGFQF